MADLSTHAANRFLTWLMTGNTVTRPSAIYAALYTSPTTEVSGNGYSRKTMTFSNGSNRGTSNTSSDTFAASGGSWGNITHLGLFDAATNGNLLWLGVSVSGPKLIENGDELIVHSGAVTIAVN